MPAARRPLIAYRRAEDEGDAATVSRTPSSSAEELEAEAEASGSNGGASAAVTAAESSVGPVTASNKLLKACGMCGRFMLDVDQHGCGLDMTPGPHGEVPIRCSGCNLTHGNWASHTLLNEKGLHQELVRRMLLSSAQDTAEQAKHLNKPLKMGLLGMHAFRTAKQEAPTPFLQELLKSASSYGTGGKRDAALAGGRDSAAKFSAKPPLYSAWCRHIGAARPCTQQGCVAHYKYDTRRLAQVHAPRSAQS